MKLTSFTEDLLNCKAYYFLSKQELIGTKICLIIQQNYFQKYKIENTKPKIELK